MCSAGYFKKLLKKHPFRRAALVPPGSFKLHPTPLFSPRPAEVQSLDDLSTTQTIGRGGICSHVKMVENLSQNHQYK